MPILDAADRLGSEKETADLSVGGKELVQWTRVDNLSEHRDQVVGILSIWILSQVLIPLAFTY